MYTSAILYLLHTHSRGRVNKTFLHAQSRGYDGAGLEEKILFSSRKCDKRRVNITSFVDSIRRVNKQF